MKKELWLLLLAWVIAWVELGWLVWLALLVLLMAAYWQLKGASVGFKLLGLLMLMAWLMKAHAMVQQQQQLPVYLNGQQAILSGCYRLLDGYSFPLTMQLINVKLLRPGLGGPADRTKHWQVLDLDNSGYLTLSVYDRGAIQLLRQQQQGLLNALVQLRKPSNYANPKGFDYVRWSQRHGQLGRGYVKQVLHQSSTTGQCHHMVSHLSSGLYEWRARLAAQVQQLNIDEDAKKIWQALALGQSKSLSGDDWLVLNRTGTTHLLIISGLHIGLLASLVLLLWKLVHVPLGLVYWHPVGLLSAWLVALSYALMSGWGLPAQRAIIMISFVLLGGWWRVAWPLEQRLLWAAMATLLWQPTSLYQSGFWFSYIAVANLALIWRQRQRPAVLGVADWWRANWLAQVSLLAVLTPLIGALTGGLSLLAPLINLLLIPLFSLLIVPWVLGMTLLSLLLDPHHWLFMLTGQGLGYVWQNLEAVADLSWSYVNSQHWPTAVWVTWLVGGLSVLLLARLTMVAIAPVILLLTMLPQAKQEHRLVVMDVGQGLAVWLRAGDANLLYDLGDRFRSGFNLASAVIVPQLQSQGVKQLDRVYISHWDRDHSGGLDALDGRNDIQVNGWILPSEQDAKLEQQLTQPDGQWVRCASTEWQSFGSIRLRQFNLSDKGLEKNDASCVVQIEYAGKRLLLTGDIEKRAEQALWQSYGSALASDVMLAPHHGSQSSSTAAFLAHVQPRVSIISAGRANRFGHPHDKVLQTYWQTDVFWLNTAIHGQVSVHMEDKHWVIKTHRFD